MGLLNTSDWKAKWIEAGHEEDSVLRPSPYFRKEFQTDKSIKSAQKLRMIYSAKQKFDKYKNILTGKRGAS